MVVDVALPVTLSLGWSCFGRIGGPGPLASVVFRRSGAEPMYVGIDLDKAVFLGVSPVQLDDLSMVEVVRLMNVERRRRLLSAEL